MGALFANRVDAAATPEQKKKLGKLDASQVQSKDLAGEPIDKILTRAPGNDAAIGGVKVISRGGWFAARPSAWERKTFTRFTPKAFTTSPIWAG